MTEKPIPKKPEKPKTVTIREGGAEIALLPIVAAIIVVIWMLS